MNFTNSSYSSTKKIVQKSNEKAENRLEYGKVETGNKENFDSSSQIENNDVFKISEIDEPVQQEDAKEYNLDSDRQTDEKEVSYSIFVKFIKFLQLAIKNSLKIKYLSKNIKIDHNMNEN